MKIAIDITPLQNSHSTRGIGSVARNLLSNLGCCNLDNKEFLFLAYDNDISSIKRIVTSLVDKNKVKYSIKPIIPYPTPVSKKQNKLKNSVIKLSPKLIKHVARLILQLFIITRKTLSLIKLWTGLSSRKIHGTPNLAPDIYLQLDPTILLPNLPQKTKTVIMVHDLIPFILEQDYLWTYTTARKNLVNRRSSFRRHLDRLVYINIIRQNCKNCTHILADSNFTKKDLLKYTKTNQNKISPVLLGVSSKINDLHKSRPKLTIKYCSPWGYIKKQVTVPNKPFLLFAGGADNRRKIKELFAAFNNIKARGYDIALILAGDTMISLQELPNIEANNYLVNHPTYIDDIYFAGYVNEESLNWLYTNALVFVYPSVYEGFGLPILEAMQFGTPVITYRNSSIPEVAGSSAMYAEDFLDIENHIINLLKNPALVSKYSKLGKKQAVKFSWQKTTKSIIQVFDSLK